MRVAPAPATPAPVVGPRASGEPFAALRVLEQALGSACEDLFAAAPFPGDQATGHDVNRQVDEFVDALRALQAEVDDLARAMAVARSRREGRS